MQLLKKDEAGEGEGEVNKSPCPGGVGAYHVGFHPYKEYENVYYRTVVMIKWDNLCEIFSMMPRT